MADSEEPIQQIQEEIARRAAQPEAGPEETITVLLFCLADDHYAFPLPVMREISRVAAITPLPGLPPAVLGAVGLHGEVLPVLDLRRLLGLEERPPSQESRLLVVQHDAITAALLADRVEDIATIPAASCLPPPAADAEAPTFVQGVIRQGEETTFLLDLARLLEAVRHGK